MYVAILLLLAAIGIEVVATALLPRTDGFTDPLWSVARGGGLRGLDLAARDRRPHPPGVHGVRRLVGRRYRRRRGHRLPVARRADEPAQGRLPRR